jgi:hypothetical protein
MTSLLFQYPEERSCPSPSPHQTGLTEGNFLLYAIACRWNRDLTYVFGEGGGDDELAYAMKSFDPRADRIQLSSMTKAEFKPLELRTQRQPGGCLSP